MHHWVEQGQMLGNIVALMFLGIDVAYLTKDHCGPFDHLCVS